MKRHYRCLNSISTKVGTCLNTIIRTVFLCGLLGACVENSVSEHSSRNLYSDFALIETSPPAHLSVQAIASRDSSLVTPLLNGDQAFLAWLETLNSAHKTIDVQTFIYSDDEVGRTVGDVLVRAADRGVVVRLLIDDFFHYIQGSDLSQLDAHERIEVRVFNPFNRKLPPPINYLTEYRTVDGRMHNKATIVDSRKSIVGGRNVADEYFRRDQNQYFSDFDVLLQGDIVRGVQSSFDAFWDDKRSVAYSRVITAESARRRRSNSDKVQADKINAVHVAPLGRKLKQSIQGSVSLPKFKASGTVRFDSPQKLDRVATSVAQMATDSLLQSIAGSQESVVIVTPYFVPDEVHSAMLAELANQGISVTIFTNSLGATNHASVHPGYMRHRKKLLAAGVQIFEHREDVRIAFENSEGRHQSRVMIHSKMTLVDGRYLLAGSLNFDPRSIHKNTETLVMLDSPELVELLDLKLQMKIRDHSYQVSISEDDELIWSSANEYDEILTNSEPVGSLINSTVSLLFSLVPPGFSL